MPGGRPMKLTPEVRERILSALNVGTPIEHAANAGGVAYATLRRWIKRGERQSKGEYHDFAKAVGEARAKALARWLAVIDKAAATGDWKAAAWKAEHAFPEFFGKSQIDVKQSGKVEVQHGGDVKVDLASLSNEDLAVLERILEKQQAAAAGNDADPRPGGEGSTKPV